LFTAPSPVTPKPPAGGVALRNLGSTPILVRGLVSQAAYSFAAGGVSQVDPQDVDALLRTRLFRREP
jgi:hypothetical protein